MRIGILGGGQLAKMLILAGYPLGLNFMVLDPKKNCCASEMAPFIHADYNDREALIKFINSVDLITFENENLPIETLEWIEAKCAISPGVEVLRHTQDRLLEKQLFDRLGIPTNQYQIVNSHKDLLSAGKMLGFPFLLKTRREGYDGKGQFRFEDEQACKNHPFSASPFGYIAESYVDFSREISIVACRNEKGQTAFYDISENLHEKGILIQSQNCLEDPSFHAAKNYCEKLFAEFKYIGTIAIEFFEKDQHLIANEIAPRVHNSGHWTIEGAATSQFENHLRAILGWPLGSTASTNETVMYNIIGCDANRIDLLEKPGLHLHNYQKGEIKPGRKMGHFTITERRNFKDFDFAKATLVKHSK